MKIIYLEGFTEEERKNHVSIIRDNIYTAIRILIQSTETLKIPIADAQKVNYRTKFNSKKRDSNLLLSDFISFTSNLKENAADLEKKQTDEQNGIPEEVAKRIHSLWMDPGIQEAYGRQSEFQLFESAA
jgi:hypothetical protein